MQLESDSRVLCVLTGIALFGTALFRLVSQDQVTFKLLTLSSENQQEESLAAAAPVQTGEAFSPENLSHMRTVDIVNHAYLFEKDAFQKALDVLSSRPRREVFTALVQLQHRAGTHDADKRETFLVLCEKLNGVDLLPVWESILNRSSEALPDEAREYAKYIDPRTGEWKEETKLAMSTQGIPPVVFIVDLERKQALSAVGELVTESSKAQEVLFRVITNVFEGPKFNRVQRMAALEKLTLAQPEVLGFVIEKIQTDDVLAADIDKMYDPKASGRSLASY